MNTQAEVALMAAAVGAVVSFIFNFLWHIRKEFANRRSLLRMLKSELIALKEGLDHAMNPLNDESESYTIMKVSDGYQSVYENNCHNLGIVKDEVLIQKIVTCHVTIRGLIDTLRTQEAFGSGAIRQSSSAEQFFKLLDDYEEVVRQSLNRTKLKSEETIMAITQELEPFWNRYFCCSKKG